MSTSGYCAKNGDEKANITTKSAFNFTYVLETKFAATNEENHKKLLYKMEKNIQTKIHEITKIVYLQ